MKRAPKKTGVRSADWRRRQAEGIARAQVAGHYAGRPAPAREKTAEVLQLSKDGVGPSEIAVRLGIGQASVFRILARARKAGGVLAVGLLVMVGGAAPAPPQQGLDRAQRALYVQQCRRFSAALDARTYVRKQNWQCPDEKWITK